MAVLPREPTFRPDRNHAETMVRSALTSEKGAAATRRCTEPSAHSVLSSKSTRPGRVRRSSVRLFCSGPSVWQSTSTYRRSALENDDTERVAGGAAGVGYFLGVATLMPLLATPRQMRLASRVARRADDRPDTACSSWNRPIPNGASMTRSIHEGVDH